MNPRIFPARLPLALAAILLAWGTTAAAQDPLALPRAQFDAAYAAIKPGPQPPEQPGDGALKSYPLYPYLQAARIGRALVAATTPAAAADADAAEFLKVHAGEPVVGNVRLAWLTSLAARGQWAPYLAEYRDDLADPQLRCQALAARIETQQTEGLEPLLLAQWFNAAQLPLACEPAFSWAREQNIITPALIEQRARLILVKGDARFARLVARPLPADVAAPLLQWADLIEHPRREIDALIAAPAKSVEPAALLGGWTALVRSDLDYALTRYDVLVKARKLDADAASPYALALALRLSWSRHAETLRYFGRVRETDLDEVALEWRVRANLWSRDWQGAAAAIAAMPIALRETARWRYWNARATAELGDTETAQRLYVSVLGFDNYYSAMSAARLDQTFTPNPVPVSADDVELRRLSALPGFVRARELLLAGMRGEAFAEWQVAVRALSMALQPQAVHLGMRWEWYDVSISTATQQRIFEDYSLLYPRPYDVAVKAAAKRAGLPAELVYGVMRQESLYRADAVSSAGAVGLLQLLPATARSTARQSEQASPKREDLFNPAVNVSLGAAHIRQLRDRFGGQVPVALAGYNAGPNAALRWLPDSPVETDIWLENIPYNETRNYVQRILWHSLVFSWLDSGQPQSTKHWLTFVSRSDVDKS